MSTKCILKNIYFVLFVVSVFTIRETHAQGNGKQLLLNVNEVVTRVLGRSEIENAIVGRLDAARARVAAESKRFNPEISYEREQLFGQGLEEAEDVASLSQKIDISRRRSVRTKAAEYRVQSAEAESLSWRLTQEREARVLFYRVLHARLRAQAVREWVARFKAAVRDVEFRATAGDVSEYDRLRLLRELAGAKARLATEESSRNRIWALLAALIREPSTSSNTWPRTTGDLTPRTPPPSSKNLVAMVEQGPGLTALSKIVKAGQLEQQAASRWWIPNLTLRAGYKTHEAAGDRVHGFVVGVSMPLPFFDRRQAERLESGATERVAEAEWSLTRDRLIGVLLGLREETIALANAAQTLRTDTTELSLRLLKTTDAAYRGGELGVLELIDVYDRSLDAELYALDLELATRRARIDLDCVTGGASR
ncbi:MAG: TolC family protein [Proteobacteria bacterium]|nr:TolC family protein [Pseudomonadota bacterium]